MINKITDAISEAIYDEFGDGHEIYTEEVEQGLQEPCFAIIPLNLTNDLYRNKRYYRKNPFCIHYFPSTNDKRNECNKVLERLYSCLEYIEIKETVDGQSILNKTMGTNMNAEYTDGVLHFFVNYDMFVYKVEEKEPMDSYDYNTDVKG